VTHDQRRAYLNSLTPEQYLRHVWAIWSEHHIMPTPCTQANAGIDILVHRFCVEMQERFRIAGITRRAFQSDNWREAKKLHEKLTERAHSDDALKRLGDELRRKYGVSE
jgi:hypothetical protein